MGIAHTLPLSGGPNVLFARKLVEGAVHAVRAPLPGGQAPIEALRNVIAIARALGYESKYRMPH
ncbi:MAG TPA: hypothetical protein VGX69_00560 [Solirubrobacteraceae bacterium]|nr:hypothetical protein [Solirubrobacteraceae bacterium]